MEPSPSTSSNAALGLKMSARKTHRKTRSGCRTCKQRKIKCDEQRPSCNNCIKHSVQCEFLASQPFGGGIGLPHNGAQSSHGSPHNSSAANFGGSLSGGPSSGLNLLDLELLHNYVTSTAFTIHTDPAMKIFWRINLPQVGFSHDFVMRGILALSALHMAHYKPERRDFYISQAMLQYQSGLPVATENLSSVAEGNCTGVYAFSTLTILFTLASPRRPDELLLLGENGMADWLFFVRSAKFFVNNYEKFLRQGLLGPMFVSGSRQTALRAQYLTEKSPQDDPLTDLGSLIARSSTSEANTTIYLATVETLRKSFAFYNRAGPAGYEPGDAFTWIFEVTEEYLQLLGGHTQEALAILAYFSMVLKRLESHWWMQGWSTHLISRIWDLLDEEHR